MNEKGCNKIISIGLDYQICGQKDKYGKVLLCKKCGNYPEEWDAKWVKHNRLINNPLEEEEFMEFHNITSEELK